MRHILPRRHYFLKHLFGVHFEHLIAASADEEMNDEQFQSGKWTKSKKKEKKAIKKNCWWRFYEVHSIADSC